VREIEDLERFVHHDELGLLFDARQKAPGRGAWVTPTRERLEAAIQGGFSRGFKKSVDEVDADQLIDDMIVGIGRRLADSVRSAIRARSAFVGTNAVAEGMRTGRLALLIIANDASDSTAKKYGTNADRKSIVSFEGLVDGREIARWCAREFVATLGLAEPFATRVARDLRHLRSLGAFGG